MKYKIKPYKFLCALEIFMIDGKEASAGDFGVGEDICPESAEPYGCGNMRFMPFGLKSEEAQFAMKKYKITEGEYATICGELAEALSFGECGCCI